MKQRKYIDVNMGVGRQNFKEGEIPYKEETLLEDMVYHRVHTGLVFNHIARDYAFVKGNKLILEFSRNNPRIFPVGVVIPHVGFELEGGDDYYIKLIKGGIKGFRVFPKILRHSFDPFYLNDMAKHMIVGDIPLMVEIQEIDWRSLREVLDAFPQLKVVLLNTSWGSNRDLFPLMDKYENLCFDLSSNQANDILKICKSHFGIERVLFGTGYPHKVMGGLKALVEYSGLSEGDKDRVSYKNAMELFNLPEPLTYGDGDLLLDGPALKMDQGQPLDDILVIDSHSHLVDGGDFTSSDVSMVNGDGDSLVKKMDMLGIDKICISPWEGIKTDGICANETSLRVMEKYGDRVYAYACLNPNYDEDLFRVIPDYHEKHGSDKFIGIKPYYPSNKYNLLGSKYMEWFEYSNEKNLIMLVHSGLEGIAAKVEALSEVYPRIAFLMAHSGASYRVARENLEVVKKRNNVYLEITYTSLTYGIIEYMVRQAGAEKVLFGTDMPMRDPAPQLAWVCYSKISLEDKKKILGLNMKRLIDRTKRI